MSTKELSVLKKLNKELKSYVHQVEHELHPNVRERDITYNDFLSDRMLLVQSIREGIPYSIFRLIQGLSPFNETDWASLLGISTKSLQRYRHSEKKFKPVLSEKIIEMAEVTQLGLEVFGDMNKFRLWLETPNFSVGNMKPIDLLANSYGKEMITGELTRINYGILV
jgi:putative toxin-antitoxin system antitoxin component (TIGR02293 family)